MKPVSSPAYIQIEQEMLSFFKNNNYAHGDQIPTEAELGKMFQVSRTTIRKTLQILESKGLISRSRGKGTFYTGKSGAVNSKGDGKTLGIVNFYYTEYIYTDILKGIEEEAAKAGYSVVIANVSSNVHHQSDSVEWLIKQGVAGLIIEPMTNLMSDPDDPLLALLNSSGIPAVTTHWGIKAKNLSTVTLDDDYAARLAARYLIEMGHRRIAYIYKEDVQAGHDRMKGFTEELEKLGHPLSGDYLLSYNSEEEKTNGLQSYLLTKKLLTGGKERPTAIFYLNDNCAVQGYRAIAELGLKIPEDISVLGFDDFSTASIVSPALTTFEHPKSDLGRWVAKILIDEIECKTTALPMKLIFEPKLIKRDSVRKL